jgi:hypothetical protein
LASLLELEILGEGKMRVNGEGHLRHLTHTAEARSQAARRNGGLWGDSGRAQ